MRGSTKRGRHRQHIRYGLSNRSVAGTGKRSGRRMRSLARRIQKSPKARRYASKYR